ncbi:efflux RND transporter periplasmic adaptor subunit [Desulfovulcanus sp.]
MKKIISFVIVLLVVIAGAVIVKKKKEEIEALPKPMVKTVAIKTVLPKKLKVEEKRYFLAFYRSIDKPKIASKISGFVKKIYVNEGKVVKKGDLLVQIDDQDIKDNIKALKNTINAARKGIEALETTIESLKSDYEYAKQVYERNISLYKMGAISKNELDISQVAMQMKQAKLQSTLKNIEAKREELKSLKLTLRSKENLLKYTQITSPINAVVGNIFIREGDLATPGKAILELLGDKKKLEFTFPQNMVATIKKGVKVYIGSRTTIISNIYPNARNNLAVAEIYLDKPLLYPEESNVQVEVVVRSAEGTAVPVGALFERKEGVYIFVYKNQNFEPIKVQILAKDKKFAIVSPEINHPIAVGSRAKLMRLFFLKNVKAVTNE